MPNTLTDSPQAAHILANDQPLMEANNLYYGNTLNVDHQIGPANGTRNDGIANEGYHKTTHLLSQGTWNVGPRTGAPGAVANTAEIFGLSYTPDTTGGTADIQLFAQSANGGVSQLTANHAQSDGWVWSGGLLFQWGQVISSTFSSGSKTGTIAFKDRTPGCIPFPNNCFFVICTAVWNSNLTSNPDGAGSVSIDTFTLSKTSFTYQFNSNSSKYRGFFWYAVGQ